MKRIYKTIKGIIQRFFQRIIRGFDDSETWSLNNKILEFIQPRLQRLGEITIAYPENYKSLEDWKNELIKMSSLLNELIKYKYCEYDYKKDKIKHEAKRFQAYYNDLDMFMEWLKNNICMLWW